MDKKVLEFRIRQYRETAAVVVLDLLDQLSFTAVCWYVYKADTVCRSLAWFSRTVLITGWSLSIALCTSVYQVHGQSPAAREAEVGGKSRYQGFHFFLKF